MSGSTIAPMFWPAKMALAIGMPLARLFFEPQKVMAISSARSKPRRRLPNMVTASTSASMTTSIAISTPRSASEKVCHSPDVTAWLKAR
ncbi:hypothetical protein D3C72_2172810 [compost metagenome]